MGCAQNSILDASDDIEIARRPNEFSAEEESSCPNNHEVSLKPLLREDFPKSVEAMLQR
jgi:hypothetical protein